MTISSLISIVVPCYNQAQYLDECLQSVLDQTYKEWECIIVNDGSSDNTEEVAKKWTQKDPRFKYIKKDNGGLSSARNAGIEKAQGEWILPLDSDDKIGSQYLELAKKEFGNGYSIIYCEAEFFGINLQKWNLPSYNYEALLTGNQIFCSAFYQKNLWTASSGYDERLRQGREDWDFWLTILTPESKVKKLKYIGFFYRRKQASMDVFLNDNKELKHDIDAYIYCKHQAKYQQAFGSPIKLIADHNSLLKEYQNTNEHYQYLLSTIRKNLFTKLFFKISEKL